MTLEYLTIEMFPIFHWRKSSCAYINYILSIFGNVLWIDFIILWCHINISQTTNNFSRISKYICSVIFLNRKKYWALSRINNNKPLNFDKWGFASGESKNDAYFECKRVIEILQNSLCEIKHLLRTAIHAFGIRSKAADTEKVIIRPYKLQNVAQLRIFPFVHSFPCVLLRKLLSARKRVHKDALIGRSSSNANTLWPLIQCSRFRCGKIIIALDVHVHR